MTIHDDGHLAHCPLCGEVDFLHLSFTQTNRGSVEMRVKCYNCNHRGPFSLTEEGAQQLWNDDVLDYEDAKRRSEKNRATKSI